MMNNDDKKIIIYTTKSFKELLGYSNSLRDKIVLSEKITFTEDSNEVIEYFVENYKSNNIKTLIVDLDLGNIEQLITTITPLNGLVKKVGWGRNRTECSEYNPIITLLNNKIIHEYEQKLDVFLGQSKYLK